MAQVAWYIWRLSKFCLFVSSKAACLSILLCINSVQADTWQLSEIRTLEKEFHCIISKLSRYVLSSTTLILLQALHLGNVPHLNVWVRNHIEYMDRKYI